MRTIEQVHEGMDVVDAEGEALGTVEEVVLGQGGDADAGEVASGPGAMLDPLARGRGLISGGPDVPEEQAEALRTAGYVKVDGRGLLGTDLYAAADEIASVSEDQVRLTLRRSEIESRER